MLTEEKIKRAKNMKKNNRKSKLETLTEKQIEAITAQASQRKNIPLVQSKQVNMRLSAETFNQAKKLAQSQNKPLTTFLINLLKEDIGRLWKVFDKAG